MKKLLSRITIALFVTLSACYPVHVMAEGRYQGVSSTGISTIWVVDTKTGLVKNCIHIFQQGVSCSAWSKDRKEEK